MKPSRKTSINTSYPGGIAVSHFKPRLQQLLQALRIDVSYERGSGDHLYFRDPSGHEIEVLDLVGGYGSLLLGHSHPALVAEAHRLLTSGRPIHSQGSRREMAEQLARELSRRVQGDHCAIFGNSGAEAVEAAMKHAMLESGARTFIALERGFHGKTLGALQLTGNETYRDAFELSGVDVIRVPANDMARLEAVFAKEPAPAGFIFEPVLGEGGVRLIDKAFAQRAAELCAKNDVPLIADECQTGLGRTGTFLACEQLGIRPDYIVLSKSLGGGMAKISALLIRRERYRNEFDLKHTSTFADDDFSCSIALKTLAMIDDALLAACRAKGGLLLAGLRRLATKYPSIVADVRGQGLMLAVEFRPLPRSSSFLLRYLSSQEDLAYALTGHLLNVHRIRVAPTLSDRFSLRLEPSAGIAETEITRFLAVMDKVCSLLADDDAFGLTGFLRDGGTAGEPSCESARTDGRFVTYDEARFRKLHSRPAKKVAGWLCHLIDGDDLISLEPAFGEMSGDEREDYLSRLASRATPIELGATDVRSKTGEVVRVHPILLPVTSRWIKQRLDSRRLGLPEALVQMGFDLAQSLGCQTVGLGQYTSIVTRNGTRLAAHGTGVTTGNSFAVALAIEAVERALRESLRTAAESTLVVAGAAGNIGRTIAEILGPRFRKTHLLGSTRPGSQQRLRNLSAKIPNSVATTDLAAIAEGDVVVAALNAVDAPLMADLFKYQAIVCDLSVPASVPVGTALLRPDLHLMKGGIVALPFEEDLEIVGFPLPAGQTFGCMAEAMLLALEGIHDVSFTGTLSAYHVTRIADISGRHGFHLADYKSACVLGGDTREEAYAIGH